MTRRPLWSFLWSEHREAFVEIQATEAKARFSELLKQANAGETIRIKRHGEVVARLLPPALTEEEEREKRIEAMRMLDRLRERLPKGSRTPEEIRAMSRDGLA